MRKQFTNESFDAETLNLFRSAWLREGGRITKSGFLRILLQNYEISRKPNNTQPNGNRNDGLSE